MKDNSVTAVRVAGSYSHLGGDILNVGPQTGHRIKVTKSSPAPLALLLTIIGAVWNCVSNAACGCKSINPFVHDIAIDNSTIYVTGDINVIDFINKECITIFNKTYNVVNAWAPCLDWTIKTSAVDNFPYTSIHETKIIFTVPNILQY